MGILRLILLFFIALSICLQVAAAKPEKIVSMNLCTDQLVMLLADRENIASISYLAAEPSASTIVDDINGMHLNHGLAEEILQLSPDLVFASEFTTKITTGLLKQLGYRVELLPIPNSIDDVISNIRFMAEVLEETERGEEVIASMIARLDAVKQKTQYQKKPVAALYWANSYTSGKGTLASSLVSAAGYINLGSKLGLQNTVKLPLETLVSSSADILVIGSRHDITPALANEMFHHPALNVAFSGLPIVDIPHRLWICGTPKIAEVVEKLQSAYGAALDNQARRGSGE